MPTVQGSGFKAYDISDNWVDRTLSYDAAGRLVCDERDAGGSLGGVYSSSYTYDRNSNITSVTRKGYDSEAHAATVTVDDLTLTYEGNQVKKISDAADVVLYAGSYDFFDGADSSSEYSYDANGNVTADSNRGIAAIAYNVLNLPSRIDTGDGYSVRSLYSASGAKLAVDILWTPDMIKSRHFYLGDMEFVGNRLLRVSTPYGYFANGIYHPYTKDYQGNIRTGKTYYAYGLPGAESRMSQEDPYGYSGKEFLTDGGLNFYDFGARTYVPDECRFWQPDPLADDYHWLSPYAYCGGDPINRIDPDGCSIYVSDEGNGIYRVVQGNFDDDYGIYLAEFINGQWVKIMSIGETPTLTSFYNSDRGEWAINSLIDTTDKSGITFINNMTGKNTPGLLDYMYKAMSGNKYDFKKTNGTTSKSDDGRGIYRGMPIGLSKNGATMFASARDIGNIIAGYVAGANGLTWTETRLGFDGYQSWCSEKFDIEGLSSQNAQAYGFKWSRQDFSVASRLLYRFASLYLPISTARFIYHRLNTKF